MTPEQLLEARFERGKAAAAERQRYVKQLEETVVTLWSLMPDEAKRLIMAQEEELMKFVGQVQANR